MRTLLIAAVVLLSSWAYALDIPDQALGRYDVFRAEMILAGWEPVAQPSPTEEYPEVQCGTRMCIAAWFDGEKTIEIALWLGSRLNGPLLLGLQTQ